MYTFFWTSKTTCSLLNELQRLTGASPYSLLGYKSIRAKEQRQCEHLSISVTTADSRLPSSGRKSIQPVSPFSSAPSNSGLRLASKLISCHRMESNNLFKARSRQYFALGHCIAQYKKSVETMTMSGIWIKTKCPKWCNGSFVPLQVIKQYGVAFWSTFPFNKKKEINSKNISRQI